MQSYTTCHFLLHCTQSDKHRALAVLALTEQCTHTTCTKKHREEARWIYSTIHKHMQRKCELTSVPSGFVHTPCITVYGPCAWFDIEQSKPLDFLVIKVLKSHDGDRYGSCWASLHCNVAYYFSPLTVQNRPPIKVRSER